MLTGVELALALISVDENLGAKVLGLTTSIVLIAAWFGVYSGIDFLFRGKFLFIGLLGLLLFNLARMFVSIRRGAQRISAAFGVLLFTGYLLFDFNRLKKLDEAGVNTWPAAMELSIGLYLDIINLFLELLDLLSDQPAPYLFLSSIGHEIPPSAFAGAVFRRIPPGPGPGRRGLRPG